MTAPKLELIGLRKDFTGGAIPAVDGVHLTVAAGETLALLGPSGCGKSTTLNLIVGMEEPSSGDIRIDGRSVVGLAPAARNIGLVFQDYAVFTHMTVAQNLAFGLSVRGQSKAEIAKAVGEVAELLGMGDRLRARARDLGGSELQRVAIGRTLVTKPAILLLDEPLSNLEAGARLTMRRELRRLQREIGLTIIYVTHDQIEALSLADRIAVMSAGKIRQIDKTATVYDTPDHVFVASFLGSPPMNLVRGRIERGAAGPVFQEQGLVLPLGAVAAARIVPPGEPVILGIRPEALGLLPTGDAPLQAKVTLVEPRGPETVVTVETGGVALKVVTGGAERPQEGQAVGVAADPASFILFSGESNRRLVA